MAANHIIGGATDPLKTALSSLSPLDSRQKIYIEDGDSITPDTFNVVENPYPHLRVHVHKKVYNANNRVIGEYCVGVFEIDNVEIEYSVGKVKSVKISSYHQVYSTAQGKESATEEDGYLNTTKNSLNSNINYNEKYKNIIFYASDTKKVYINGELYGGSDIADGSITEDKLDDTLSETIAEIPTIKTQIAGLLWGSASLSISGGTTVYANSDLNIKIKAAFSSDELTPDSMIISLDNTELARTTKQKTVEYSLTEPKTSGNYIFVGKASVGNKSLTKNTTLYVRNAVYKGIGLSAEDVFGKVSNKHSAVTTIADGSFRGTVSTNGSRFFLLVPSDVTSPSVGDFTMGGAPASFTLTNKEFDGISYNIFSSNGEYDSGAVLNFKW